MAVVRELAGMAAPSPMPKPGSSPNPGVIFRTLSKIKAGSGNLKPSRAYKVHKHQRQQHA